MDDLLHDRVLLLTLFLFDVSCFFLSDKANPVEVTTEWVGKCSFLCFCSGRRWLFFPGVIFFCCFFF